MAKSVMPKSKAKTAYGLLSEISDLILEEPRRYDQGDTLVVDDFAEEGLRAPACGTIGCVAGWVVALKTDHRERGGVTELAGAMLGLNEEQEYELFFEFPPASAPRQTRAHAKWGARHIAKFQKKYAKQLKAKRV